MNKTEICIESYSRLKNLKLVENETGIKWQSVYSALKKAGISVTGDKKRYGSTSDKLASKFERVFGELVPFAVDNNDSEWQSTVDFHIGEISVDVKVSKIAKAGRQASGKSYSAKWSFCISKQKDVADFFVLFSVDDNEDIVHTFLIPSEIAIGCSTISIPLSMNSKWADFEISKDDLFDFFFDFK